MSEPLPNATDIDRIVGERIRRRRVLLGLTQDQLADGLGISYQQVQKYETGANRVSAGRLYQIALSLETTVSFFFDGISDELPALGDGFSSSRYVIELVRNFSRITDERVRTNLMGLVRSLAEAEPDDASEGLPDATVSERPLVNGTADHG